MIPWAATVLLAAAGYLLGAIPTGVLVGRLYGADPRAVGSGRVGATNAFRAMGWRGGGLVALGDLAKGLVITLLALRFTGGMPLQVGLVGLCTVLGQVWSIFLLGRGGRGVATSAGVALALWPLGALVAAVVLALVIKLGRMVSLASLLAAAALVGYVALAVRDLGWTLVAVALCLTVWFSHLDSIRRLAAGTGGGCRAPGPAPFHEDRAGFSAAPLRCPIPE